MLKIAFSLCMMAVATSSAIAKEYVIQLDGYCDKLRIHIDKAQVFGESFGKLNGAACDDSLLTGTVADARGAVTPAGNIVTAAGDLGAEPAQFVNYIDLDNNTFTLYGTDNGTTMFVFSGTWSAVTHKDQANDAANLPAISTVFFHKAVPAKLAP
jgi:hypothetical protein